MDKKEKYILRKLFLNRKFICLFISFLFIFVFFIHLFRQGPEKKQKALRLRSMAVVELRRNKQLFRSRSIENFHDLKQIPQELIDLLIFQEDQTFFSHGGYSLRDIFIVFRDRIWRGHRLRGASTLTQQLARSLFLDREKSLRRKLNEFQIARVLEKELDKNKILELYLNHAYWGHGAYGIAAASQLYFRRKAINLNSRQSIFLVSILPHPSACRYPHSCKNKGVLRRMRRLKNFHERKNPTI